MFGNIPWLWVIGTALFVAYVWPKLAGYLGSKIGQLEVPRKPPPIVLNWAKVVGLVAVVTNATIAGALEVLDPKIVEYLHIGVAGYLLGNGVRAFRGAVGYGLLEPGWDGRERRRSARP